MSPKEVGLWDPFPNGRTSWLINGGDPNHLLTGMILQVVKDAQQSRVIHVKSWVGFPRFHGRMWKRKNHVYYDWVWQLSVCFFKIKLLEMIPNLYPMVFSQWGWKNKHENQKACTPGNIEMENGSGLKMYFLAKMGYSSQDMLVHHLKRYSQPQLLEKNPEDVGIVLVWMQATLQPNFWTSGRGVKGSR